MRKRSSAMTGLMWYVKFSYRYHSAEDNFLLASLKANNTKMRFSKLQVLYQKQFQRVIHYNNFIITLLTLNSFIIFVFIVTHS